MMPAKQKQLTVDQLHFFYQLYQLLQQRGLPEQISEETLSELNERGFTFSQAKAVVTKIIELESKIGGDYLFDRPSEYSPRIDFLYFWS